MAYDQGLARRIREILKGKTNVREVSMFGGLTFMLNGRMCCGVAKDSLMVRVLPERYESLLEKPHARVMEFTGRPLSGFLFVGPQGYRSDSGLKFWLEQAIECALSKPGRKKGKRR